MTCWHQLVKLEALWPLFHYLLWQDVATEYASADVHWAHYTQAQQVFAERIASILKPGDLIWVHDYHLLLVPKLLRGTVGERGTDVCVHSHAVYKLILIRVLPPQNHRIVRSHTVPEFRGIQMLAASQGDSRWNARCQPCLFPDLLVRHFTSTCVRVCGYETTTRSVPDPTPANTSSALNSGSHISSAHPSSNSPESKYIGIDVHGHIVAVSHCPVGIDDERVARDTLRPGVQPKLEALRALYADKKIIVGRDKLDVVKERQDSPFSLRASEKLLHDYPEWQGQVVLIQVMSPSLTDSPKLERQVSELVAHINGEYGSLDFIPVHHYHQSIKKDEFYALLSVADLGVIMPLRGGTNTTSMVFFIAQDRTKRSPLVLTLQINPWDLEVCILVSMQQCLMFDWLVPKDVAVVMNAGLLMSSTSKEAGHAALHQIVTTHTSHTWAALLVGMLLSQINGQTSSRGTPYLPKGLIKSKHDSASKCPFLSDHDGTPMPIVKTPSIALPSFDALNALTMLVVDPRNIVYIVSGRDQAFLEMHL
ncbi:hypothetical protein JVU11DRAFT_10052 [Chiua virens]|nr:hypothetical protein JVU11DRAFT_10052 [Chiua virens]